MDEIRAYKCEFTGRIFENRGSAVRSEFKSLLRRVGAYLPRISSDTNESTMTCLAEHLCMGLYEPSVEAFLEAADYLKANKDFLGVKDD